MVGRVGIAAATQPLDRVDKMYDTSNVVAPDVAPRSTSLGLDEKFCRSIPKRAIGPSNAQVKSMPLGCLATHAHRRLSRRNRGLLSARLVTRNQFSNLWDEICRNVHDGRDR